MATYQDNLSQNFGNMGLGPNNGQYPPRELTPTNGIHAAANTVLQRNRATDTRGSNNNHLPHHTTLRLRQANTARPRQHRRISLRRTSLQSRVNGGPCTISSTSAGTMPTRTRARRSGRRLDTMRPRSQAVTLAATMPRRSSSTSTTPRLDRLPVTPRAVVAAWAWPAAWRWALPRA